MSRRKGHPPKRYKGNTQRKKASKLSAIPEFTDAKSLMDYMLKEGFQSIPIASLKGKRNTASAKKDQDILIKDTSFVCVSSNFYPNPRTFNRTFMTKCKSSLLHMASFLEDDQIKAKVMSLLPKKKLAKLANEFPGIPTCPVVSETGQMGHDVRHSLALHMHQKNCELANFELCTILKRHNVRIWEERVAEDLKYIFSQHVYNLEERGLLMRFIERIDKTSDSGIDPELLQMMKEYDPPR